jgi:prephenate dehydratase
MTPYEAAIEWIESRPIGSTFTRTEFYIELLCAHLFTAQDKGSFNCALKNSSSMLIPVAENRWMRTGG